jgi:CheY-like chemotaxis protein
VDAVSLDVRLPDPKGLERSGLTLLAYLRASTEHAHLPVLIFTGQPLSQEEEILIPAAQRRSLLQTAALHDTRRVPDANARHGAHIAFLSRARCANTVQGKSPRPRAYPNNWCGFRF